MNNNYLSILIDSKAWFVWTLRKAKTGQAKRYDMEAGVFRGRRSQKGQYWPDFQETSRPYLMSKTYR
jgi:hypothetical protein